MIDKIAFRLNAKKMVRLRAGLGSARSERRRKVIFAAGILIFSLALAMARSLPAAEGPTFTVDPTWPKPMPHNWKLGPVTGMTADEQGNIWVLQFVGTPPPDSAMAKFIDPNDSHCCDAPPVVEFDHDGTVVQAWGGPGTGYDWPKLPHGILVDHNGFVWIAGTNKGDGQVLKFTRDGKFVMQIGHPGGSGKAADTTAFSRPANFSVDTKAKEIYIADGYGNRRLIVFDTDTGKFKRMWGAYGKPPVDRAPDALKNFYDSDPFDPKGPPAEHFNSPVHCAVLSKDGLLYVCDRSGGRVQVFHPDGTYVREFLFQKELEQGGSGQISDLVLWPDAQQTYLIAASSSILVLRRSDGEVLSRIGKPGEAFIHLIAMDHQGNLYTGEVNQRVRKWVPTPAPGH